jgi:CheY-like chemotaxis protein
MEADAGRILIVDDDPDYVLATGSALKSAGYEVAECLDSTRAMESVRRVRPDLVVLDVMMERGAAGFEIARQLRRDPEFARLPILMVTAVHQTTKLRFSPETDGEYLPVDGFVDKPVEPEVLLAKVAELLKAAGEKS